MRYLMWSNSHGGWWKANRHGYTLDINDAAVMDEDEADRIVLQASHERPEITRAPVGVPAEVAVLHPDLRWDSPPQVSEATVTIEAMDAVTGISRTFQLPVTIRPLEVMRRLEFCVGVDPIVSIPFQLHDGGTLHTMCSRIEDPEPDRITTVEM